MDENETGPGKLWVYTALERTRGAVMRASPGELGPLFREYRLQALDLRPDVGDRRLTQQRLAELSGYDQSFISKIETGAYVPDRWLIDHFASVMHLSDEQRWRLHAARDADWQPRNNLALDEIRCFTEALRAVPLVDQEQAIQAIVDELQQDGGSLLTLTGIGGVGKSRLAVEVADRVFAGRAFPGGVFLVLLKDVDDPALVLPTIASALGIVEHREQRIVDVLATFIGHERFLLVLDSFDRVLEAVDDLTFLLAKCPKLSILVTSRAGLPVQKQHLHQVRPLNPDDCVALFEERARAAAAEFARTDESSNTIGKICRQLEGLPLAIIHTAPWTRALSPEEILAHVQERGPEPPAAARDLSPGHQTLVAMLDWSYEQLSTDEMSVFQRVALFPGGCSLPAAEKVAPVSPPLGVPVKDVIWRLINYSLVQSNGARYTMYSFVREYARTRLERSGGAAQVERQYTNYFVELAEATVPQLTHSGQFVQQLDEEYPNVRVALRWAVDHSEGEQAEIGLRLGAALAQFWELTGRVTEGRWWLAQLLEAGRGIVSVNHARTLRAAGALALRHGDLEEAERHLAQALELSRALHNEAGTAAAIHHRASVALQRRDYATALQGYEESKPVFEHLGDDEATAYVLLNLGVIDRDQGRYEQARRHLQESVALARKAGDKLAQANALSILGGLHLTLGNADEAEKHCTQSVVLYEELRYKAGAALARHTLAVLAIHQSHLPSALIQLEELSTLYRQLGDKRSLTDVLHNRGALVGELGDIPAAKKLFQESLVLSSEMTDKVMMANSLDGLALIAARRNEWERAAWFCAAADTVDPRSEPSSARLAVRTVLGKAGWRVEGNGWPVTPEQIVADACAY